MKFKPVSVLAAVIVMLSVLSAGKVAAHAGIDRSVPKADSTVTGSPAQVEIWFTQEVTEDSKIEVAGASGAPATAGDSRLDLYDPDRKHMTVELLPNLPDGVYTVSWTSVSEEDGDTETGSFTFTISGSGTPVASPVASPLASPAASATGTPPDKVSGTLQSSQPKAEETKIDDRALAIALGAGVIAALLIYGFWRLVRPRRHPFDRTQQ
ncbi:MAG: copper resistance protein CopC [Thermomicrobiales bacterium]|nr:copper resistance protein CopC [Thermomicrobiales bacterium]